MISSQQELLDYVAADLKKNEGIWYPLKTNHIKRMLVTRVPVSKLHPNPADEFSMPSVGPSFSIINNYREKIRQAKVDYVKILDERLIVEKIAPDGYMIINGHHRWSALMLERIKYAPVEIVNLTHYEDLHSMLNKSDRDKRVAFDLDEVIFASPGQLEDLRTSNYLKSLFYKDRIRIGRASLINTLHGMGYDVWVYTRGYHSTDYIEKLFDCYNFKVDGIFNGIGRGINSEHQTSLNENFAKKYKLSLHIDNEQISFSDKATRKFIQKDIEGPEKDWSKNVISLVSEIEGEYCGE